MHAQRGFFPLVPPSQRGNCAAAAPAAPPNAVKRKFSGEDDRESWRQRLDENMMHTEEVEDGATRMCGANVAEAGWSDRVAKLERDLAHANAIIAAQNEEIGALRARSSSLEAQLGRTYGDQGL